MAINENGVLQISNGTIFHAPAETPLPDDLTQFTLDADTVGQWTNMGDLSNDNKVSFSTDGGEATTLATWRRSKARTIYSDVTGTLTGNSVQLDSDSVKFLYNGWDAPDGGVVVSLTKQEQKLALFILGYDPNADKYFGIYMPNTSFSWSGLPDFTSENFTEVSFTASTLDSDSLPKSSSGKKGTFAFYDFTHFKAPVAVRSISVTPETANVEVGSSVPLTVAFDPADATNTKVTATSSDDAKATATVSGGTVNVTGKDETEANKPVTVTVTSADGGKTDTVNVTVTPKA